MNKLSRKILVVEDEAVICLTIEHSLKRLGYTVAGCFPSGEECLAMIESNMPDLVLMDIQLSGKIDGIETAAKIRDKYDLPVVFLTAFSGEEMIRRARTTDPFGYLVKPFNERDLYSTIEVAFHRHQLLNTVRDSERKFREIAVSVDHVVLETDNEFRILYLNPYGEELFRTGPSRNSPPSLLDYIYNPEDHWFLRQKIESGTLPAEGSEASPHEIRIRVPGDRILFFEEHLKPVVTPDGIRGLRGILVNITRHKYRETLREALLELSELLGKNSISNDGFIFYLIKLFRKLTGACSVYYNRYDSENNAFFTYEKTSSIEITQKVEQKLSRYVIDHKEPLFLQGPSLNAFLAVNEIYPSDFSALCWIGIPIRSGNEVLGVLGLQSYRSESFFSRDDFEVFRDCGFETSYIFQNIAFRNKVSESEFRYKNLVESVNEGIIHIDFEKDEIVFANEKFSRMLELDPQTIRPGSSTRNIYFLSERSTVIPDVMQDRLKGKPSKYEICITTPSGKEKWFFVSGTPMFNANEEVTGSMSIWLDITEQKESERKIREGSERLDEISRHIHEAFWLVDWKTKKLLYGSPSFGEIFGQNYLFFCEKENLWFGSAHADEGALYERFIEDAPKGDYNVEYRLIMPDQSVKWVNERAFPIRDKKGEVIRIAGYSLDTTEQKMIRMELAKSEGDKEAIINAIPDSLLIVSSDGEVIDYYRKENVGLPTEKKYIIGKKFVRLFNPGHRRKVQTEFQKFVSGKKEERTTFSIHDTELGLWHELRFVHIDESNKLILIRNVTRNKKQEAEVKKFFNLVEQSEEIILISDRTGIIEYVNPKFSEVSGYQSSEVIGKMPTLLNSGKHSKMFFVKFWKTIMSGKPFTGEITNRKKNGELYVEAKIVTPLFNENGEIVNFISTGRDITEQRETEHKLEAYRKLQEYQEKKQARIRTLSLLQGQEEERKRISRELHDGLGQILSATKIYLERIGAQQGALAPDSPDFSRIHQLVMDTIQEVRRISNDLSPSGLHDFGLLAAVRNMVAKLNDSVPLIRFSVNSNLDRVRFKSNVEISVFRIIQEAVNNAIKHSSATRVEVNILYSDSSLRVSIMDDGVGFETGSSGSSRTGAGGGNGLSNMHERAKIIGGKLLVVSEAQAGTLISFELKTSSVKK